MRQVQAVWKVDPELGYGVIVWSEDGGVVLDERFFEELGEQAFQLPSGAIVGRRGVLAWGEENLR
jgi:hypothetical protein